jgi:Putative DNA-binding domain
MTALRLLQDSFQWALMAQQPARPGVLARQGHFSVYLQAYRARLRAALRDNYEVLAQVMGDDDFDALAGHYIALQPSRHYSLRWFGHHLPDFMAANPLWVSHPALQDLATLEWALRDAFDAADQPVLQADSLRCLPASDWPGLQFSLHPSVQLLSLKWAVGPVWNAIKSEQAGVPAPEPLEHTVLVWREGLQPRWMSLDASARTFLQAAQSGQTFGALCETLAQTLAPDEAVAQAAGLLHQMIGLGVLCAATQAAG